MCRNYLTLKIIIKSEKEGCGGGGDRQTDRDRERKKEREREGGRERERAVDRLCHYFPILHFARGFHDPECPFLFR